MDERGLMQVVQSDAHMLPAELQATIHQMGEIMRGMADMLRATNERMGCMERELRLLTKVTPAQASEINAAIRNRAAELCELHRAAGCEKPIANAIRRALRLCFGMTSVREMPRCEYSVIMEQIKVWDDYKLIKQIRVKGAQK